MVTSTSRDLASRSESVGPYFASRMTRPGTSDQNEIDRGAGSLPSLAFSACMCFRAVSLSSDIVSSTSRLTDARSSESSFRALRKNLGNVIARVHQ